MTRETLTLRSIDVPRIARFGVGFDQLLDELVRYSTQQDTGYPPYNIIRDTENLYRLEMAVAGFDEGEVDITVENQQLIVTGSQQATEIVGEYLHKGISNRNFRKVWPLADHVEVISAEVKLGILTVTLERQIPESMKPKSIAINYSK